MVAPWQSLALIACTCSPDNCVAAAQLPDNVDTEHVEAKLENGELIVKVPKVEQPEKAGRIINVQ